MLKVQKIRSPKHLKFIASLPCLICLRPDVQAAHIRTGNKAGMGLKSGDDCCIPLCIRCHRLQGQNEKLFWARFGGVKVATVLAKGLYAMTGNRALAIELIQVWRKL